MNESKLTSNPDKPEGTRAAVRGRGKPRIHEDNPLVTSKHRRLTKQAVRELTADLEVAASAAGLSDWAADDTIVFALVRAGFGEYVPGGVNLERAMQLAQVRCD